MTSVYEVAYRYVEEEVRLDPLLATIRGVTGYDAEVTDYSPDGIAARAQSYRRVLLELSRASVMNERERIAAEVMRERLEAALARHEIGEPFRELRVINGPVQFVRQVFDLMPVESPGDWEVVRARMAKVPLALAGLRTALDMGLERQIPAPRRQALACAQQAETWGGQHLGTVSFFHGMLERLDQGDAAQGSLRNRLPAAADAAAQAYCDFARYLRIDYVPRAAGADAVGRERYEVAARGFLGSTADLEEGYRWAWDEVHGLEVAMAATAARILPGAPLGAVIEVLETDPARAIEGAENFRTWLQELMDRTIAELHEKHFDIPEPIRRVEAMIAPPGGAAAMYYTGPSENLQRPGRTWYPTRGRTRFPLWGEVSTAYHEGVPGHHLQVGQVRCMSRELSRFQCNLFPPISGHAEGWALYSERLMAELGYLENPDYEFGMLRSQRFRAARVVVDIGMHLGLRIPHRESFHPGSTWTAELGHAFMKAHGFFDDDLIASEIERYLGWPAQAISYKLGERVWMDAREHVRRQQGSGFDLKRFHMRALSLGPMGLDQLRVELEKPSGIGVVRRGGPLGLPLLPRAPCGSCLEPAADAVV